MFTVRVADLITSTQRGCIQWEVTHTEFSGCFTATFSDGAYISLWFDNRGDSRDIHIGSERIGIQDAFDGRSELLEAIEAKISIEQSEKRSVNELWMKKKERKKRTR